MTGDAANQIPGAFSQLLHPLARIAAMLAGISALAYALGFAHLTGYFERAGAGWAIGLFSPVRLMQVNGIALVAAVLVLAIVAFGARYPNIRERMKGTSAILSAVLSLVVLVVVSLYEGTFGILAVIQNAAIAGVAFAAHRVVSHAFEGPSTGFFVFYAVFLSAIVLQAGINGYVRADKDFALGSDRLPEATIAGEAWHLVVHVQNGRKTFRVLPFQSIEKIE
jgi:hypothetical protein